MPISAQLADAVQAAQASGPFRIAKIRYQQGATLNSEFVVIKNVTHRRHNLRGYLIVDPNDGQRYRFPRTILRAGARRHRAHRIGAQPARSSLLGAGPVWNNDGDTALLKNPSRRTVDRCSYNGTEGGTKVC